MNRYRNLGPALIVPDDLPDMLKHLEWEHRPGVVIDGIRFG